MTRVAIVLAGGDPVDPHVKLLLPEADDVIAADSGIPHAAALGLHVDVLVGDLDSADPLIVDAAVAAGTVVERHPADKDATDLELALDAALARGASRITVVGGAGGRIDHHFGNVAVLGSPRYADIEIDAHMGDARVVIVRAGRPPLAIGGAIGSLVTLLAMGGDAFGVTTTGLQYPLRNEDLPVGTTRGLSNVVVAADATVELERGTLLVVQPFGSAQ